MNSLLDLKTEKFPYPTNLTNMVVMESSAIFVILSLHPFRHKNNKDNEIVKQFQSLQHHFVEMK